MRFEVRPEGEKVRVKIEMEWPDEGTQSFYGRMSPRDAELLATALRDAARRITWKDKKEGKSFNIGDPE